MKDKENALAATRAASGTATRRTSFVCSMPIIHHEGLTRQEAAGLARKLRGMAAQLWQMADDLDGAEQIEGGEK